MSYEFSDEDAGLIKSVGQLAFYIAIVLGLGGLISASLALLDEGVPQYKVWMLVIQSLLQIVGAWAFLRPSDNLKNIAETEGNDITELMISMEEMSVGFFLAMIIIGLSMVIDIALLVVQG